MKKHIRTIAVTAVIQSTLFGCQSATDVRASGPKILSSLPGQTLSAPSTRSVSEILATHLGRNPETLKLERQGTDALGVRHVQVRQEIDGVRIVGAYTKASLSAAGQLLHVIDATQEARALPQLTLSAVDAVDAALVHHGYQLSTAPVSTLDMVTSFARTEELYDAPSAERVGYVDEKGSLQSGYLVETWGKKSNLLHHTLIDAQGHVVSVELRTNNDAYNVFVEDPSKGPQTVVQGPGAGNTESPIGWLSGAQLSVNISGNNARAYLDADGNNRIDRGGTSIVDGQFLAVANLAQAPNSGSNLAVAVQNLFYLNNRVHDELYRHGFNEASGNFQVNNFGKGGQGADPVLAEAQDGSGTDNANFSTPADGRSPRMQMYLWTGAGATHEVVVNSPSGLGTFDAAGAEFGSALTTTGLTGSLAVVNDGVGVGADACEAIATSLAGKIALVERGTCAFTVKVLNAQKAGATAVVVINTQGDAFFTMGGTERKVRIPSVMIGKTGGTALASATSADVTARKKAAQPLMVDGDVDSDIVFHEYGHGLTWRMIGGMSGPLAGAIGEGASDTVAFLLNGDAFVGEYASGNVAGIRRYPYTGYPLTYSAVTGAEVHDDGEIYAAAMWRLHELFAAAGYSDDTLLSLFVDGMNYTPSTPAFEDMRDGMIQASNVRGGAYTCLIWKAFAQFGIGQGAKGTATANGATITESFTIPATCL